jgi:hypothetical protein
MKITKTPLFWICIILLIVIGYLVYSQSNVKNKNIAVYLSTGELYFGQKSGLFGFNLKNAYLLNKGEDGKYSLQEFSKAAWKPTGTVHLSSDKVVFWSTIDDSSDVSKLVSGETKSTDVAPAQTTTTPPSANGVTTQK